MTPIDRLRAHLTSIADAIRDRTGDTEKLTLAQMSAEIEYMPAGDDGETYILVDENGNEIPAVLTEEEVDLTATANDIRLGSIAVTDDGVIEGTKEIPSYYTTEGMVVVMSGKDFTINSLRSRYDFTKLQALFCSNSVVTDKVCINTNVYPVNSKNVLSTVTVNAIDEIIDFGITNDTTVPYVIRYFTYKEEY